MYGNKKAKISLKILHRLSARQNGKYVIVGGNIIFINLTFEIIKRYFNQNLIITF